MRHILRDICIRAPNVLEAQELTKEGDFICEPTDDMEGVRIIGIKGADRNRVTSIIVPQIIDEMPVREIGRAAFKDMLSVAQIKLPDGITRICESALFDCQSLKTLVIPNSVTQIDDNAFSACSSLAPPLDGFCDHT